jgi:hypothetical protein
LAIHPFVRGLEQALGNPVPELFIDIDEVERCEGGSEPLWVAAERTGSLVSVRRCEGRADVKHVSWHF